MRDRVPGAAVMEQVVRLQESVPPRSALARAFGVGPLTHDARSWFAGALGEREVGGRLARLPEGWHTFHALPVASSEGDVDHLVVGPGGVFVVTTKHHRGAQVTVADRSVDVSGTKQTYVRTSDVEASRVRGMLARAGIAAPVSAVVAIVGAKGVTVRQQPRRVAVLRSESLVGWLTRRPTVVDAATVGYIAGVFDDPGSWSAVEHRPDTLERFAMIEREVRSARWIRTGWALAGGLGVIAVVLPFLPH